MLFNSVTEIIPNASDDEFDFVWTMAFLMSIHGLVMIICCLFVIKKYIHDFFDQDIEEAEPDSSYVIYTVPTNE